jgi:hypothetical protein
VGGWHVSDEAVVKLGQPRMVKTADSGIPKDQRARRKKLQQLLPGVAVD